MKSSILLQGLIILVMLAGGCKKETSPTEEGFPPDIPVLSSPLNGNTGLSVSLTLRWDESSGATSYTVQVSTSSSFTTLKVDTSGITNTYFTVGGLNYGTKYYWRVKANNSFGESDYSTIWSFTTLSLEGRWQGTTGQNLSVYFHINASGAIDTMRVYIRLNLVTTSCTAMFYTDAAATITNASFTAILKNPNVTTLTTTIRGTFSSGTASSGTYDANNASATVICGSGVYWAAGGILSASTWQATKQ
jgi:hypothetical protein